MRKIKSFYSSCPSYLILLLFTFFFGSCETEEITVPEPPAANQFLPVQKAAFENVRTFYGPAQHVGNGVARAYVNMNKNGTPESIGVRISEKALENLPEVMPGTTYTLTIPKKAKDLPFDHIDLNYNPEGHPDPEIYGFEHFDFHFYMINQEEKFAMDDQEKGLTFPDEEFWPESYEPEAVFVPYMGTHWVDRSGGEFTDPGSFSKTFIYGSYDASFIFYEPMITIAHLETKEASTNDFPPLTKVEKAAYYPTTYSIGYDSQRKEHVISLENMSWTE